MATAPAQYVRVSHVLDTSLNVSSFRLGDIAFGDFFVDVPDNRAYYSTRVDVRDSLGVYVDVTAGINVVTREAFWILESIDPATGQEPTNPLVGLLLVNDSLGRGQGSVSYSARPRNAAVTGERIDAVASIYFDNNAPVITPAVLNTIDAGSPTSSMAQLPVRQDSLRIHLAWSGEDDAGGSGIAFYTLYIAQDNGAYSAQPDRYTDTLAVFEAELGHEYRFQTIATDNAGNAEGSKISPDAFVFAGSYALPTIEELLIMTEPTQSLDSVRAVLSWLPVTVDTLGNPLDNISYRIYYADSDIGWNNGIGWTLHGQTADTTYRETSYRSASEARRYYFVVPVIEP